MSKYPNWESKVNTVIERYYYEPMVWGKTDCLCFVADGIWPQAGINIFEHLGKDYRGSYSDEAGANELLVSLGGVFTDIFDRFFAETTVNHEQRGDAGLAYVESGPTFGLMSLDGRNLLLKSETGLRALPIRKAKCEIKLWRVRCLPLYSAQP